MRMCLYLFMVVVLVSATETDLLSLSAAISSEKMVSVSSTTFYECCQTAHVPGQGGGNYSENPGLRRVVWIAILCAVTIGLIVYAAR